jgi:Na+/H+ antiporter NhaD/arsenite permease-like protein
LKKNLLSVLLCLPWAAQASSLDGAALSLGWGLPFAAILMAIALLPMLAENFWHHHFGKVVAGLSTLFLLPFALCFGLSPTLKLLLIALLTEYLPFLILLLTLYTLSGGILLSGRLHATPWLNTRILALGALLAPVMGTTGASMLLIRPLLRANKHRHHKVHVVMFFIFLVANIGGGLTPLGDPPLFLGFLNGVSFSWTFRHMLLPVLTAVLLLLALFYALDRHYFSRETRSLPSAGSDTPLRLSGRVNLFLLLLAILAVLLSGIWKPGIAPTLFGVPLEWQNLVRDASLLLLTALSLHLTPRELRVANEFNWQPISEVAKLFAGIFITIAPVIAMLRAGANGPLAWMTRLVTQNSGAPHDQMYFWMTGLLSSFLDNAPTYLVFFNMAAGDAQVLMGPLSSTLTAISMGAVFMGAMTYIGNAPNFMIRNIARHHRVKMPGFFAYMGWSCVLLLPLLLLLSCLYL